MAKRQFLLLLISFLSALNIYADDSGSCGSGVTYTYVSSTNTLTIQGTGIISDYLFDTDIPWYSYRNEIKTVVVEDGVTSIGSMAFYNCSSLTSVTIGNSVTSIGSSAFVGCTELTDIEIPSNVTSIGGSAFRGCSSITSLNIPNSVTSIGMDAFYNCSNLTTVTIGSGLINLGAHIFEGCTAICSITVDSGNTKYDSRNNCNAIIEKASNTLVAGCKSSMIPNGVTSIGEYAFLGCSGLTSITIPNSVTSIGYCAFLRCSALTSIMIPSSVATIGYGAFGRCSALTSISVPNSVTSVGDFAFSGLNLTSMTINKSDCSTMYLWFGSGDDGTSIKNIIIGTNVSSICGEINSIKGLESIQVDVNNTKFDSRNDCNAIIQTATNTLVAGCKNSVIPNSVTAIGKSAFSGCSGLTTITIPNSVTAIGKSAFSGCSGLTTITIPNSVTSIGDYAFSRCSGLTTITIPNSVTSIGDSAFSGCSGLATITIPNSVTSIGDNAFSGCTGLSSFTIPSQVTSIGSGTFSNCSNLSTIIIPNSVTNIKQNAFLHCSGLTSVTIGKSVTNIGYGAFQYCYILSSVKSLIETPFSVGDSFDNISNDCVLTVPYGTRDAYIAAGWTTSKFKGGVIEEDNVSIAMKTSSGADRTMIGYSCQYSLDFTDIADVKAYIAIGFTDTRNVMLARVNIVPANTGVVLKSDVAGVEVEVPITTKDVYYANLLKSAVNNVTIHPTETIDEVYYTNFMVGKLANNEMGFVTFTGDQVRSNSCYMSVPTSTYENTIEAFNGGYGMVFVDTETTGISSLKKDAVNTNDTYYDMLGRKVTPSKNGLYISNGKKIYIQ